MTRNQRLSRALMYGMIVAACVTVAFGHVVIGRSGVASLLMTMGLICTALMMFHHEES